MIKNNLWSGGGGGTAIQEEYAYSTNVVTKCDQKMWVNNDYITNSEVKNNAGEQRQYNYAAKTGIK